MRSIKLPSWIEKLAGLEPRRVPGHVFALDERRLAYARFERRDGGAALAAYAAVEIEPETFQPGPLGGSLRKDAAFSQALSELLQGLDGPPIHEACLLLPDAWLRLAFSEMGDLPKDAKQLDEALRWKLKRLVPFRVDELRIEAAELTPLAGQEEPRRALIGFALDSLLGRVEDAFAQAGIQVGYVGNVSMAVLPGLAPEVAPADGLLGLVLIWRDGYTLLFAHRGEPVLHRYKASDTSLPYEVRERRVDRDLKLTRNFLEERVPGKTLERVLLLAAPEVEEPWQRWIEEGLGCPAQRLDASHLAPLSVLLSERQAAAVREWLEIAPLLGASCLETA